MKTRISSEAKTKTPPCYAKTVSVSEANAVQALNGAKLALVKAKIKAPESGAFSEANRALLSGTKLALESAAKAFLSSAKTTSLSEAKAHGEANLALPVAKITAFKKG